MSQLIEWEPLAGEVMPPDADLLARWSIDGDRDALERLVRRHGGLVLGVCRRILGDTPDADDAFQAVFLVFLRKAHSLDRPEHVAGWLHGVALLVARKVRAERARRHERETAIVDPVAPATPDDPEELRRTLDEELDRLPEKYRLPILLCELEGHTLDEAARLLGWPRGTVAGRLSRGRDLLRRRLARKRNGLGLPLLFGPALAPSEQLVGATLDAATGSAPAAELADAVLRDWSRWAVTLLALLVVASGLYAAVHWTAPSRALAAPPVDPNAPTPIARPFAGGKPALGDAPGDVPRRSPSCNH